MQFPDAALRLAELRVSLANFTASVENLIGPPSPPDSPLFFELLAKCDPPDSPLDDDDAALLYRALLQLLREHGRTAISDPALLEIFGGLVSESPSTPLFEHFCRELLPAAPSYARIAGANLIVVNADREPRFNFNSHASVTRRRFNAKTVRRLNREIANLTRGLIPNALSDNSLSQSSTYVLINTLAFVAKWERPFDRIVDQDFHLSDGSVRVPFLSITGSFKYHETASFTYVSIPYAHCPFQFEILIPRNADRTSEAEGFHVGLFEECQRRARPEYIRLSVPQFQIESPLIDFSSEFQIPDAPAVHQVALVAIDQFGTKAAAGTVITDRGLPEISVTADRQFTFQICGEHSGDVLFAGVVADPRNSESRETVSDQP
jgi:hypothetical protein